MNKFELTNKIEKIAPLETQDSWDCSGWLVCTNKKDISKVMLALTITDDVYNQAKEKNCDMIISHHPLFFVPLKYSDIDMYCAHTNMDKAIGGTTDTLLETLGLKADKTVEEYVRVVDLKEEIFDEQRDYYNTLVRKGWYKVDTQPTSKINQELMKLETSKSELDNYYLGE